MTRDLQQTALKRLEARSDLAQSGKLSLKLKVTKSVTKKTDKTFISVDVASTGDQLAQQIASLVSSDPIYKS